MGKKNTDVVHIGKKSFWSGKVRTLCGLTYEPDNAKQVSWFFSSKQCPACRAADKRGARL